MALSGTELRLRDGRWPMANGDDIAALLKIAQDMLADIFSSNIFSVYVLPTLSPITTAPPPVR